MTSAVTRASRCLLLALCVLAASCGDDAAAPPAGPGVVKARLVSANAADGAALIELRGDVTSVTGVGTTSVYTERIGDMVTRVMLVSMTGGRLEFQVEVPERRNLPIATVLSVADTANQLRASVSGYAVQF